MSSELQTDLVGGLGAGGNTGIDKIAETIKTTITTARKPANDLPPFLTTIEHKFRPGLSAITLTSNIVTRLGEAGIETGTLADGSEPQITKVVRICVEEIIKEIQLNMKIMIEIPPGVTTGQAGPVPVLSTLPIQGGGVAL